MSVNGTVLLVEDNANDVELTRLAFAKARLANPLQVARDGEEAIAYLGGEGDFADRNSHPFPILMLVDLNLPRINGFEILEWMRQQPFRDDALIAILTTSDSGPDVRRAYELGADSYLIKPPTPEAMLALVQRLKAYWLIVNEREVA